MRVATVAWEGCAWLWGRVGGCCPTCTGSYVVFWEADIGGFSPMTSHWCDQDHITHMPFVPPASGSLTAHTYKTMLLS